MASENIKNIDQESEAEILKRFMEHVPCFNFAAV